jgi:DNA polymerase-1
LTISNAKFVAIDTETNGEDIRDGRGKLLGISLAWRSGDGELQALYLPFFHEGADNYEFGRFRQELQDCIDKFALVFHNSKFDLVSLGTAGLDTSRCNFYDTMLLAHQISEAVPVNKSLDSCAKYYLGAEEGKKNEKGGTFYLVKKALGWARIPAAIMAHYAAYDAHVTYRLFEALWPKVCAEGTQENWKHRREMVKLIIKMEANGVRVDTALCEEMAEKGEREMERLLGELGGLNPNSVVDLPVLLINKLGLDEIKVKRKNGTETRSFDKKAMEVYEAILSRRNDQTAQRILTYRGWGKSVSSNYQAYLELLSPDGRLRPNYKLHGTKTGRLSCEKPNLQQIPKGGTKPWNGRMKACFIPQPGYVLIEADYSQLEFRLGAAYAKEEKLLDVFNNPERDIFDEMSAELKMARQDVKTQTYSIQYGGGVNRISTVFGISANAAKARIDNYYNTYPGLKTAAKLTEWEAKKNGKVQLWSGRYRHFQFPQSEAFKAFNSKVQGGAADIVERTMRRMDDSGLNTSECRMLLQVHDSVVFEIREDLLPVYKPQIKHAMEAVEPDFGVRFACDIHRFGE